MLEKNGEKFVYGGSSSTPLHCTERNSLEACVDWLSITFRDNVFLKVIDLLHLTIGDFESQKLADGNEYDYLYKYSNIITIMVREVNPQKTKKALTYLDIKGQGCRFLENNWLNGITWVDFFNIIQTVFTIHHLTRLDVAIDDYVGYLNINTLHRKMRLKQFKSTAGTRSWRYVESGDIQEDEEFNGQTLYVGKGDVEFRFYDKKKQLKNVSQIELDEINIWNRYEMQLRHERALAVMQMIARDNLEIGELVRSIMCEYLCFLVPSKTDSNKRRWSMCKWWKDFIGDVVGVRLTMQPLEKNVYKTKNWIEKQGAIALAILDDCFNDNGQYFRGLVADGQKRMTKQHKQMIEQFRINEAESAQTKLMNHVEFEEQLNSIFS